MYKRQAEGTRAGYVYYSHVILDSVGLTDLSTGKDTLKKGMEAIKYDINNDTDIALGLTEAVKLLKEGKAFNSGRNPMVVLLSDGRTDLPKGPRTVEAVSYTHLKDVQGTLKKQQVTVGSIVNSGYYAIVTSGLKSDDLLAFPYGNTVQEGAKTKEVTLDDMYNE